jgi:putative ABC transport system permease protein
MRAIHKKLLRDLWSSRGQVLAIGLVITSGVAMFISYMSVFQSLDRTRAAYYDRYRFADVFAMVKRAPDFMANRLREIPGVAAVETRVAVGVNLDLPGEEDPVAGLILSIPAADRATLNDVAILRGRYIEPDRPDEVLVSDGFAKANGLGPGSTVAAVINGKRRELEIVGIALSPEYIYIIRPGEIIPDESRYGLFWMNHKALSNAYDMEGAFNDVALKVQRGASAEEVIDRVNVLLERYGCRGAVPRRLQTSHWYVENELKQLRSSGFFVPAIFFGVAAFLLHVTLNRLISVQREQIAALKALGYTNREIGLHYTLWSLAVALFGCILGIFAGQAMGRGMIGLYNDFFRFPFLEYRLSTDVVLAAVAISVTAAIVGAFTAVSHAVKLPPAEAMRPEPPAKYRRTLSERLGLGHLLSQPTRMILRNLERRPGRALVSTFGIAIAGSMMVVGLFVMDAIDELLWVQWNVVQRQDMILTFVEARSPDALYEVSRWPGVMSAEPQRSVAARLRFGHRYRELAITGLDPDARLQRVVDVSLEPIELPPEGLVLSKTLADLLGVRPGQEIEVEVLEGKRPKRTLPVAATVEEYMGTSAYMRKDALHRFLRESPVASGALLQVDPAQADTLYRRIKKVPAVAGAALKAAMIESFRKTTGENMGIMVFFNAIFAGVICFGVSYNAARIALSERSRELASLRVIGFTRGEIAYILLGEQALINLVALPLSLLLGTGLALWLVSLLETELYRFPFVLTVKVCAYALLVIVVAAVFSGLVVRRKLDKLDLVAVLKTRE